MERNLKHLLLKAELRLNSGGSSNLMPVKCRLFEIVKEHLSRDTMKHRKPDVSEKKMQGKALDQLDKIPVPPKFILNSEE